METIKPQAQESGRGRLQEVVVYETLQLQGFQWESLMFLILRRLQEVIAYGGLTVLYM